MASFEDQLQYMQEKCHGLEARCTQLEEELKQSKEKMRQSAGEELEPKNTACTGLQPPLRSTEQENIELKEELEAARGKITALERRNEELEPEMSQTVRRMEEEVRQLRECKETTDKECSVLQEKYKHWRIKCFELREQLGNTMETDVELEEEFKENHSKVNSQGSTCYIPEELIKGDPRVRNVTKLLKDMLKTKSIPVEITPKEGEKLEPSDRVVIPCVYTGNCTSDAEAALKDSKISKYVKVILLFFYCRAKHVSNNTVSSERKLKLSLSPRYSHVIDFVYWNKEMYDCDTNEKALGKFKKIICN